ncbi:MAG: LptF/LptG family permease [Prevotellaceae bacterium]|jgi:lipopolysaccharide export system permease protein|nr:LptF/LptG family permease [Prevotellaceae bacterium]
MKIFDRFTLKSYLGPMILTFFIVLFILMLNFLWLYIDDLIGKGLSLSVIVEFIFWGTASFIPLALPLSTLLASIMTMGNLGESNELLAMKSTGISLQRIIRPLMALAITVSIGAFFISNNFLPYANLQIKTLLFDIKHKREEIKIPAGVFYNGIEDLSLYVDRQDEASGMMYNIMLYDHRAKKGNISVTLADSGYIRLTENKQHIIFSFYHGYAYEEGESGNQAKEMVYPFQRRYFDRQEVLVPLEGYDFQRSDGTRFSDDAQIQNINRLSFMKDSLKSLLTAGNERFLQTFVTPGYLPNYNLKDSVLRARQIYTAAFDSLYRAFPVEKQLEAAKQAYNTIDRNALYIANYAAEQEKDDYPRRSVAIEWHRKFTLSFACLIFFFIGAPLGAIIRKGGLGMPAVVSIFFFVIYWVIDISGKKLSRDGAWDPLFGTWVSSMVLLPIGIFLTYKATSDSSLFNAEKYIDFFRNIAKWLKKRRMKYEVAGAGVGGKFINK